LTGLSAWRRRPTPMHEDIQLSTRPERDVWVMDPWKTSTGFGEPTL
jgi:hypothetical protein